MRRMVGGNDANAQATYDGVPNYGGGRLTADSAAWAVTGELHLGRERRRVSCTIPDTP